MATGRWFPDPLPLDDTAVDYIVSAHKLGIPITLIHKHMSIHDYDSSEAKISKVLKDNSIFSLKFTCFSESGTWKRYLLYLIRKHEPNSLAHLMTLADERSAYGLGSSSTDTLVNDYFRSYHEHQTNLVRPENSGAEFGGALWIATAFMDLRYNIEHVFHDITSKRYRTCKERIMELYEHGYDIRKNHTGSNEPYLPQLQGDVDLLLIKYCAAAHVMGMKFDHILMMAEIFGERVFTEAELQRGL
ncbi:hypothetical protein MMC31_003502, partial [Peltigera leucophlebia]|nr:hypothetical protein [Peltigera leucophlebia]